MKKIIEAIAVFLIVFVCVGKAETCEQWINSVAYDSGSTIIYEGDGYIANRFVYQNTPPDPDDNEWFWSPYSGCGAPPQTGYWELDVNGQDIENTNSGDVKVKSELIIGDNSTNEWSMYRSNAFEVHSGVDLSIMFYNGGLQFRNGAEITTIWGSDITTPLVVADLVQADEARIDGKLFAKQVTVTLDAFPDFVFSPTYNLKTLSEIEEYIEKNGTLPGMPSENKVRENGLDLGEMQAKLLEKLEEMTLYMISLEKKNNALEAKVNMLEKKVESE